MIDYRSKKQALTEERNKHHAEAETNLRRFDEEIAKRTTKIAALEALLKG